MRAMRSSRIALVIDEESARRLYAAHIGASARLHEVSKGDELTRLVAAGTIDGVVAGVLNRTDEFLPLALRQLGRLAPEIPIVGVFEPSRPSLDEAADLARELPAMGFVCRPGPRLAYLIRGLSAGRPARTVTPLLVGCIDRLPLFGAANDFALLQALHPSFAIGIPEQARELGVSRRNLERWFQGPDICSAGAFQSVCAAAEAGYLKMTGTAEREIAAVLEVLSRDGIANPMGVSRAIRSSLHLGLEELRAGGLPVLVEAVNAALRTPRDPSRTPAQWGPETRYAPERGVLTVSNPDGTLLMDSGRELEHPLDHFGLDAWPLIARGMPFSEIIRELSVTRREPPQLVRARLVSWLGELLVLRLIRREPPSAEAGEA